MTKTDRECSTCKHGRKRLSQSPTCYKCMGDAGCESQYVYAGDKEMQRRTKYMAEGNPNGNRR